MTTDSLNDEMRLIPEGKGLLVTDANHTFLEFRLRNRTLVADFYAADSFAKHLPDARQIQSFAAIEKAIHGGVRDD
jgi:hypothetical protein